MGVNGVNPTDRDKRGSRRRRRRRRLLPRA